MPDTLSTIAPTRRSLARRVAAIACAIAAAVGTSGCPTELMPEMDGGSERDAALVEGGQPDAATFDSGVVLDGSAPDGGPAAVCTMGDCDPRVFACGDGGGTCSLRDRMPMCVGTVGTLAAGAACTMETECGPGLACFRDGRDRGICAEVCCPGTDSCLVGDEVCSADGVLVNGITTSWGRCAAPRSCDVLMPECAPREGCYIVYPDPGDPQCLFAGSAEAGEDCLAPQDCSPGLYCAGIGSPKTCVRVCRIGVTGSCPAGEGDCVAQAYSPAESGVCVASTGFAP